VVLTSCCDLIEERVVLVPHVCPVDALHGNHQSLLDDHKAVPICIKVAPKMGILVVLGLLVVFLIWGPGDQLRIHVGVVYARNLTRAVGGAVNHKGTLWRLLLLLSLLFRLLRDGIWSPLTGAASHRGWHLSLLRCLTCEGGALAGGVGAPLHHGFPSENHHTGDKDRRDR
jgi:hypothetical protein